MVHRAVVGVRRGVSPHMFLRRRSCLPDMLRKARAALLALSSDISGVDSEEMTPGARSASENAGWTDLHDYALGCMLTACQNQMLQ